MTMISRIRSGAPRTKSTAPARALFPVDSKMRRHAHEGDAPHASTNSCEGATCSRTESIRARLPRAPAGEYLDEDALPRTVVRGLDHRVLEVVWHRRQAGRAAGVVEHAITILHVRDAVLEQREHGGRVVGAQTVAGAQVL